MLLILGRLASVTRHNLKHLALNLTNMLGLIRNWVEGSLVKVCNDDGCEEKHMPAEFYAVSPHFFVLLVLCLNCPKFH